MGENPNVIIDEEKMTEEQLYDSVFWASVNLLKEYVPLLVNETFGTHYSKNAKVTLLSNKKVVETSNDELKRREVDALLELSEPPEYEKVRHFHFECETMGRKNIVLRIAEYASAHAFENVELTETGAIIKIPYSAAIFLREESTDLKELIVIIEYPGGQVSYKVPVLKMKDYDIDELFEKKLLLLVPFFVFRYSNKEYAEMNGDIGKMAGLKQRLKRVSEILDGIVQQGEIDRFQKGNILTYIRKILFKLLKNYSSAKKEVEKSMGGFIIKTELDIAREDGIEIGEERGKAKGKAEERDCLNSLNAKLVEENRTEDLKRSFTDPEFQKKLLFEYFPEKYPEYAV